MASILKTDKIEGVTASSTVQMPAGAVLQVLQTTVTAITTTNTSVNSSTGLTVTITPKFSSSKVLVTGKINSCHNNGAAKHSIYQLYKGGSFLAHIHSYVGYLGSEIGYNTDWGFDYLDSPSTTSATTYDLQWASPSGSGTGYFNNWGTSNNTTRSTMTVFEIAG
jgi:hypothetical protein